MTVTTKVNGAVIKRLSFDSVTMAEAEAIKQVAQGAAIFAASGHRVEVSLRLGEK